MSQTWECQVCGYVYDEALGSPRDKIHKGTKFADIDSDWRCPDCQVGKEHFVAQHCDNAVFDERLA